MSHSRPPSSIEPGTELFGAWGIGEDEQSGTDREDSLFAPPPPRPNLRPSKGRSDRGIPAPHIAPACPSDALFENFALGDEAEEGVEADSLFAPPPPVPLSAGIGLQAPPPLRAESAREFRVAAVLSELRPGDTISGFTLLSELGRGAFARVFLAEQDALGKRRVALKVSRAEGDEPQILARLQHAHIVPIHSVHDDPETNLRFLCMPYLGGANLAQVLETAVGRSANQARRLSLVDALDEVSMRYQPGGPASGVAAPSLPTPSSLPRAPSVGPRRLSGRGDQCWSNATSSGVTRAQTCLRRWLSGASSGADDGGPLGDRDFDQPARQFLRQANAIQSAVWIVARLAEGLEHAHSRGLLHRDLKPSNVLIAGDATPMLLDFNLSTVNHPEGEEGEKAMLGGTLPYMSPEHLAAFDPRETTQASAVDERSDLYSLGLILFEMLAGEHPFPEPPAATPLLDVITAMAKQRLAAPSPRASNPMVPWGLDSIVRKCLSPDPDRRYARARDLSEDLKRFLEDQTLKFAPDPSIRERLAKWARRNPRLCNTTSIATVSLGLILGLGALIGLLAANTRELSARLTLKVFRDEVDNCRFLLNHSSGPSEHYAEGLEKAAKARAMLGLSKDGEWPADSWTSRLADAEVEEVRAAAVELIMAEARARVDLAQKRGTEADRRHAVVWAVDWLNRAERMTADPPAALYDDRARYHAALGMADDAARDRKALAGKAPSTARDFLLVGSAQLARGDLGPAEAAFNRATDLDPRSFWAWFGLGLCHVERGRYLDAAGDFNACAAIEPKFAWPHLNRGLALARAGRLDDARRAYGHALKANPNFAEAWLNLALADLELNDLEGADDALKRAIDLGRTEPGVLAAAAEVKARRGDREGARSLFDGLIADRPDDPTLLTARGFSRIGGDPEGAAADLERARAIDPRDARALLGLALLRRNASPREALALADAALAESPNLIDALQLRALLRARLGDLRGMEDADRLSEAPTAHRLYNAACVFALLAENAGQPRLVGRALGALERALDAGFPPSQAAGDPDLAPLRDLPEYQALLARARGTAQSRPDR